MMESYRKMNNDILRAHEENVMTFLRADERFLDCEEDAAQLGFSLSVGIHEIYTAETRGRGGERSEKFPYGYTSELEIDFVRDGYVAMTDPEGVRGVQMSITATIVRTPETLLFKRIELIPYDELVEDGTFFDAIEDRLDDIEEHGIGVLSPFREDESEGCEPAVDLLLHIGLETLGDGGYVEYQSGEFFGAYGREDSLYLTRDAAFPYSILLAHVLGSRFLPGGVHSLTAEEGRAFTELLRRLADSLSGATVFGDLLTKCEIYEFTPPGNAEKLLTAVTLGRQEAFRAVTCELADRLSDMLDREHAITVIGLA